MFQNICTDLLAEKELTVIFAKMWFCHTNVFLHEKQFNFFCVSLLFYQTEEKLEVKPNYLGLHTATSKWVLTGLGYSYGTSSEDNHSI